MPAPHCNPYDIWGDLLKWWPCHAIALLLSLHSLPTALRISEIAYRFPHVHHSCDLDPDFTPDCWLSSGPIKPCLASKSTALIFLCIYLSSVHKLSPFHVSVEIVLSQRGSPDFIIWEVTSPRYSLAHHLISFFHSIHSTDNHLLRLLVHWISFSHWSMGTLMEGALSYLIHR